MLQTPNGITVHGSYPFAGAASCDPVRMLIEKQAPDGKGAGKKGPPSKTSWTTYGSAAFGCSGVALLRKAGKQD